VYNKKARVSVAVAHTTYITFIHSSLTHLHTDSILLYVYFARVVSGVFAISRFYTLYFFMWVFVLLRFPLPHYSL
jgi:hypothetical protein